MKANGAAGTGPIVWVATSGLIIVVAVPFVFIVLQAIFPELGRSSLAAPFLHLPHFAREAMRTAKSMLGRRYPRRATIAATANVG